MSDPSVDEIKERLSIEIEVEEEATKAEAQKVDVTAELKHLGRQFAETLQSAWNSEERQRVEAEIREGMRSFADEVDKVIQEAKESKAADKVKEGATNMTGKVESAEFGRKARGGFVNGLRWLSEELSKVADKFTAPEKSPEDVVE
ncbi:MAG: hypothetical protein ACE5FD_16225 [Anaerolineae bacterium]